MAGAAVAVALDASRQEAECVAAVVKPAAAEVRVSVAVGASVADDLVPGDSAAPLAGDSAPADCSVVLTAVELPVADSLPDG